MGVVWKSAKDGKYVTEEFAADNPDITYQTTEEDAVNEDRILVTPLGERGPAPIEWCIPITPTERDALVTVSDLLSALLRP